MSLESMFAERQLEKVKKTVYQWDCPDTQHRDLIPPEFSDDPGIGSITTYTYRQAGMWKIVTGRGKDVPRSEIFCEESTLVPKNIAGSYSFTFQELLSANTAKIDIRAVKAIAEKRAHAQTESDLAWFGSAAHKIPGFIAPANGIKVILPADGDGGKSSFLSKLNTPEKVLRDLNSLANASIVMTRGKCRPDTVILPAADHRAIATTPMGIRDHTILSYFKQANDHITDIRTVGELEGAATDSVGTKSVYQCYHNDRSSVVFHIVMDFRQHEPQVSGLGYDVFCEARVAGVELQRPLSCAYAKVTE
jgi:hypothetical protein